MSFRTNGGGYSDRGEEKSFTPCIVRLANITRFLLAPASQPYQFVRNDIPYYNLLKFKQRLKKLVIK
jgi:hypothetical protein